MGLLINGEWQDSWYDTSKTEGRFVRGDAAFRNWVTPTGDPGPTGSGGFKAEPGRYHLYVSLACPWAHRTLIFRKLKRLEQVISTSVVDPMMGSTTDLEITCSSRLSLRKINVRCAHGQASDTYR